LVAELVKDDLNKWREPVRKALAIELGFEEWKSASSKKLHPVDRLTARFRCKKCLKVAQRYKDDGSLDFAGACGHQCPNVPKSARSKPSWSPDQFAKDDKVSDLSQIWNCP
jgi:hypothetical protein